MTSQSYHHLDDALGMERFFELSSDLLCIVDCDGRFLRLSNSWKVRLGYELNEMLGRCFIDFVHPDDIERTIDATKRLLDHEDFGDFSNRYRTRDGDYRVLSWRSTPTEDFGMIFAVARDVTARQLQAQKLEEERSRLRAIMDTIPDLVFIKDADFRYVSCNRPFEEFIGRTEPEVVGGDDFQIFERDVAQSFRDHDIAMLQQGSARRNEEWVTYPDGHRVLLDTIKMPFRNSSGQLQGALGISRDITAKKRAEEQLLEREALYRASIEATADGFWLVDMEGRLLDVNSAYASMSGYSIEELKTLRIFDLDAMENPDETAARIAHVRAYGSATFESRHRRADGSLWDVEVKTIYSASNGGRLFVFLHDLRRKRRADSLLRARLHLSEIGRGGDIDALMTEVLDTAERLTASRIGFFHFVDSDQQTLTLQAWSANTLARMCKAEGKGLHYPVSEAGLWADCLRQGQPLLCNDYATAHNKKGLPDGHAQIIRMLAVPVRGETGFSAVIGVGNKAEDYDQDDLDMVAELSTIAMDIVNWVRAEAGQRRLASALAETARHWTVAMDSFQDGIALLDGEKRLVRANAAFFRLTNSSPEHRIGKILHCLGDVEDRIEGCPVCDDLRLWELHKFILEANDRGNPSGKPLDVRIVPITNDSGIPDGTLVSLYDLSTIRAQEAQLRGTVAELTRSRTELEHFAQITAHDLQEPTRRQVLFAQLLHRKLGDGLDADAKSYVEQIVTDAFKMREMVHGLNTYFDAAKDTWIRESVDLDHLMALVSATFSQEFSQIGGTLSILPLGYAQGEPSRLRLAFTNLISNSLKFRRPGTPPLVTVSGARMESWLTISIADNGQGIPEEYRDSVFTPFSRLSNLPQSMGSGMGLAQCRHVVEDLGGRIWIEGNPEGGSTVKLTLPV